MKMTIESTSRIVIANGVKCRVWEGETESGIRIHCLIPRLALKSDQNLAELDGELKRQQEPTAECCHAFPLRMLL
jgi:hypothetical protein